MKYKYSNKKNYTQKSTNEDINIYSDDLPQRKTRYIDIYSGKRAGVKTRVSWKKVFLFVFFLMLGILGCAMIGIYRTLHSFHYNELSETALESDDDVDFVNDSMVLNTILIGSDSMSTGDGGRSDSMILLSLDARHKKIKLTSFMRDMWVTIPGYGQDRLNASYAFGGAKLTIDTIKKNFGVLIDRYAVVDFEGFSQIIDTLGGIDINLTADECAYINKYSGDKHTLHGSGVKHLTGLQALHYSRDRNSIGSDYDRTSRQRTVLRAVAEKLKTANIAQITELISTLGPLVTTNYKTSEISRIAAHALTYLQYPIEEFRLPTDDNVRDEVYSQKMVLVINDPAKAKNDLHKFIYETEAPSETSESVSTKAAKSSSNSPSAKMAKAAQSNTASSSSTSSKSSESAKNAKTAESEKKSSSTKSSSAAETSSASQTSEALDTSKTSKSTTTTDSTSTSNAASAESSASSTEQSPTKTNKNTI